MTITSILLTGIQGDEPVFNASIFRRDISTGQIFVTPEAMTYWHGGSASRPRGVDAFRGQRPALAHAVGSEGRAVVKLAKRKALMLLTLTAAYGGDTMALTTENRSFCSYA